MWIFRFLNVFFLWMWVWWILLVGVFGVSILEKSRFSSTYFALSWPISQWKPSKCVSRSYHDFFWELEYELGAVKKFKTFRHATECPLPPMGYPHSANFDSFSAFLIAQTPYIQQKYSINEPIQHNYDFIHRFFDCSRPPMPVQSHVWMFWTFFYSPLYYQVYRPFGF